MGIVALAAAGTAWGETNPRRWLTIWAAAAGAALLVGVTTMCRKAARQQVSALGGPGTRFFLCLLPAVLVGALLSWPLHRWGQFRLLPSVWLLHYGAGVVAAGATSVAVVPLTGAALLAMGVIAMLFPQHGNLLLGLGFGAAHVVAGIFIARRHGG